VKQFQLPVLDEEELELLLTNLSSDSFYFDVYARDTRMSKRLRALELKIKREVSELREGHGQNTGEGRTA
jgi:hypothetical protein